MFKSYPSNLELAYDLVKYLVDAALRPTVRKEEDLDAILDRLDELLRAADPTVDRPKPSSEPQDLSPTSVRQPPHQSQRTVTWGDVQRSWDLLGVTQTSVLHFCGSVPNHPHPSRFDMHTQLNSLGDRTGPTTYVRLCPDQVLLRENLLLLRKERPDTALIYFEARTEIAADTGRTRFDVTPLPDISILELLISMQRPSQVLLVFEAVDCENAPTEVAVRGMLQEIIGLNRGVMGRQSANASAVFVDADEHGPGVPLPVLLEEGARELEEIGFSYVGMGAVTAAARNLADVQFLEESP
ncbi:hypothetical protein [Streptomyces ossamyceticus]|uniref:hypothetical protein n=1 Tax=Streptomyces ossamyceticus TaxID=249581 RepID=UPI0034335174